jgi:hypothetical protein
MCPGDPLGNHGQRSITLALVFEPVLAREDGMGVSAPLPEPRRLGSGSLIRASLRGADLRGTHLRLARLDSADLGLMPIWKEWKA